MLTPADKIRVYQEAKKELDRLIQENKIAAEQQLKRTQDINAANSVIYFLSKDIETPDGADPFVRSTAIEDFTEIAPNINYTHNGTWQDKIKAVIKHANKVIKVYDMVEIMVAEEESGNTKYTQEQILGVVSNNTSKMVKDNMIKAYKSPKREKGYYYGNPIWWNGEILKDEFLPQQKEKILW